MGKFDEIFDDVVVNAKAAASAVSKKAATMYDTSKHKISAAELRGEINKRLRELGMLTYKKEVHGSDVTEEIAKLISEITELKENLAIILDHIDSIKNQKKCPKCESKVPRNSVYCNICGARIDEEEPAEDVEAEFVGEAADETVAEPAPEAVETTAQVVVDEPAE